MRDRCRRGHGPDRRCGMPALVVVTKAQNLSQRDIDGRSHRKRGGDTGGRLWPRVCHGQQRRHEDHTGVRDAERVDIVEVQRVTGHGVEERGPLYAALSDCARRRSRSVPVKCRQSSDHRLVPPAIDDGDRILHAKRGLLGIGLAQPVRCGDEPRQAGGEITHHVLILTDTAHCLMFGGTINSGYHPFAHMCWSRRIAL